MRILMAGASSAYRAQAVLRGALRTHGHAVDSAPLSSVCEYVELYEYDLVVVILGRLATEAVNLVARLRCVCSATPMLVLTGPSSPEQRSHVLDAGADDCMPAPIDVGEFLARVRALLRRAAKERLPVLRCGDLVLDPAARKVWRAGALLPLTRKELAILEYLMRRSGHVVSQEEILEHVWDAETDPFTGVVRVHVAALRRKLRDCARTPRYIETVPGEGYRLCVDVDFAGVNLLDSPTGSASAAKS